MSLSDAIDGTRTYYRVQPNGRSLHGHTSGLAYEKTKGLFAFEDPKALYDTYTWNHVRKNIGDYEMVRFSGKEVERPEDSEGVVVSPVRETGRMPLKDWHESGAAWDESKHPRDAKGRFA